VAAGDCGGMMENKILEVKKKREFSKLPDTIIARALEETKGDVGGARANLRKYFGVFLTNRVLKLKDLEVLKYHLSTKKRDYDALYLRIRELVGNVSSVIDLGCGVNGYSVEYLRKYFGDIEYLGVEAAGQVVDNLNLFFAENKFIKSLIVQDDLFDIGKINDLIEKTSKPRMVFLFQVVDALESFEKNYSKKLLMEIMGLSDFIVISLPLQSLSKGKKFAVNRAWLTDFLKEKFEILGDWNENGERFICIRNK